MEDFDSLSVQRLDDMANQSNAPVDDQLRAYAAERRRQMSAPLALPPAMRHALLAAVAQHFQSPKRRGISQWYAWFVAWPRVAWATALLVVLAAGGGALWLGSQPQSSAPIQTARQSAPAPAGIPSASPALARPTSAPSIPGPAAAPPMADPRTEKLSSAMVASAPAPQPREVVSQAFRQVPIERRRNGDLADANRHPLLERFRVESRGNQIRIIDADGSVYEGRLVASASRAVSPDYGAASAPARPIGIARNGAAAPRPGLSGPGPAAGGPSSQERALARSDARAPAELSFEAAGTNRSINQSVRIAGRFVVTNAFSSNPADSGGTTRGVPESFQHLIRNSMLRGQAVLDGRRTIAISAVPDEP